MAKKAGGVDVAAIQKILTMLKQRNAEDALLIAELEQLAGGGDGIGTILKRLYEKWGELWSMTHSGTYLFDFKKDPSNMKRLYRELGEEELVARMAGYMRDRDVWLMEKKHPFGPFVAQSNRYAATHVSVEQELYFAPVGCQHVPPCKSDIEHTKKRQAENR